MPETKKIYILSEINEAMGVTHIVAASTNLELVLKKAEEARKRNKEIAECAPGRSHLIKETYYIITVHDDETGDLALSDEKAEAHILIEEDGKLVPIPFFELFE